MELQVFFGVQWKQTDLALKSPGRKKKDVISAQALRKFNCGGQRMYG